jgi:hypothetical protein
MNEFQREQWLAELQFQISKNYRPELSMGFPAGTDSGSLISTTTQSDIKNVFATEAACSRQHLTT